MQWVLNTIIQYKNFLLYLLCIFLSLMYSSTQSNFHNHHLARTTLAISGIVHEPFDQISHYFDLIDQNKRLVEENNTLKGLVIEKFKQAKVDVLKESLSEPNYWSVSAKIIRNSFTHSRNILLIDKGNADGILTEMGVIGSRGIIGIVNQTSQSYASVLSILYQDLKINAKFQHSNVFGSLYWDGESPNKMQLADISVINPVKVGDTIVTGGMSSYFPEGIQIGRVSEVEEPKNGGYYNIHVDLFNNMTDLDYVYVIGNKNRDEIKNLLDSKQ